MRQFLAIGTFRRISQRSHATAADGMMAVAAEKSPSSSFCNPPFEIEWRDEHFKTLRGMVMRGLTGQTLFVCAVAGAAALVGGFLLVHAGGTDHRSRSAQSSSSKTFPSTAPKPTNISSRFARSGRGPAARPEWSLSKNYCPTISRSWAGTCGCRSFGPESAGRQRRADGQYDRHLASGPQRAHSAGRPLRHPAIPRRRQAASQGRVYRRQRRRAAAWQF